MNLQATLPAPRVVTSSKLADFVPTEISAATFLLHALFVGQAYSVFRPASEAAGATAAGLGEWTTSVSGAGLIAVGAIHTLKTWGAMAPSLRRWILLAFVLVMPMVIRGFIESEGDPLYTALQSLPWLASVFLPALGAPTIHRKILAALRWHAFIGVTVCGYLLLADRELIFSDYVDRSETLELKPMQFLLYSLFFQLFRFPEESLLHRLIAIAGILEMVAIAVASGSRQPIVILAGILGIWAWIMIRAEAKAGSSNRFAAKLFIVLAATFTLSAGILRLASSMQGGVGLLSQRILQESGKGSIVENARWDEIAMLTSQFSYMDYVTGRGVRGHFVNYAAPKQDNVHIGWFRTLLKGGLPVVLLLLLGPALAGARALRRCRMPLVLAAAGMGVFFLAKNSTGNVILAFGNYYLIAICFGTTASFLGSKPEQTSRLNNPRHV
jgi:hypothetical protein